jgi:hypothetical protein
MDRRHTTLSAANQQKSDSIRLAVAMRLLCALTLVLLLSGCAGGSGSSGFDVSPSAENEAINRALLSRECQPGAGLTICPANEDALHVPGQEATPPLQDTQVSTDTNPADFIRCASGGAALCSIAVQVSAAGLPEGAAFQLAGRGLEPLSPWRIAEPAAVAGGDPAIFSGHVEIPPSSVSFQVAVLVFVDGTGVAVGEINTLTETGATLGFVTGVTPLPR